MVMRRGCKRMPEKYRKIPYESSQLREVEVPWHCPQIGGLLNHPLSIDYYPYSILSRNFLVDIDYLHAKLLVDLPP